MKTRSLIRVALFGSLIATLLISGLFASSAQIGINTNTGTSAQLPGAQPQPSNFPKEFDMRGPDGVPKGVALRTPLPSQIAALASLESAVGSRLTVQYNGLTATPRHLFSHGNYLTAPSTSAPETIARDFLSRYRNIFRFSESDLRNLRLKSRATVPTSGTTILLFEQMVGGLPLYNGGVLVNVNRAGQIISVGGESFPHVTLANAAAVSPEQSLSAAYTISPEQAITSAAAALGVNGFTPQRAGTKQVPVTFGNLPVEYEAAPKYNGGVFTDEIAATKIIFPLGDQARLAYKFVLTTPQFNGIMWENIVDAQSGAVLRRISLTSFQSGGGSGPGRRGTFRPDVQDLVEAQNQAGTAQGKVTDTTPTALSGYHGVGRSTAPGNAPTYAAETLGAGDRLLGRGFKQSQVFARNENPLIYNIGFGQVLRGFPDANNPSLGSPFGWFYLPTNNDGQQITSANDVRAATQAYGYNMAAEAKTRNLPENSPNGDGNQLFSATLTPLTAGPVNLGDGRTLSSVYQSNYTEGNNSNVTDDRANDNESTHGIRGYDPNRQFTAARFDYTMGYEYGGINAGGTPFYPASSNPDVYPATVTLFYYTNLIHDYLYSIGFTEQMWNFQQDNFGNGGIGKDGLSAQVQDGSGTNNANMGTNAEGSAPRMQMYLFTEDVFRRSDGDFDFDVVSHEYYHGVSNRSAAKGSTGCLGVAFFGESGGQGEGWSDTIAQSLTDDDSTGEFVTGEHDKGIRTIPVTNFRWSYGAIDGRKLNRRDQMTADPVGAPGVGTGIPPTTPAFQVHHVGTIFSAMTWDMRELLIMKQKVNGTFPGVFFDGTRRLGSGTPFYIGERLVNSVDAKHPIDYRESFGTHAIVQPPVGSTNPVPSVVPTIVASQHIIRPGMVQAEIAGNGGLRNGPLATAVNRGARLADMLVLHGLQLSPCNPSIVDTRDSILLADKELTGGENRAVIWRAFASHGVGANAASSHSGAATDPASSMAPVVVEDFTVPASVLACEQQGPLAPPNFVLANTTDNTVTLNITPVAGAARYIVSRSESADGPFVTVGEGAGTSYSDTDLVKNKTYFYQARASRDAEFNCVSSANTQSITVTIGVDVTPAPLFSGVDRVDDPQDGARLIVSWKPATSINPSAQIVYDVYSVDTVQQGTGQQPATFTPSAANRIATGLTGTSFIHVGLPLADVQYYIVQARDTNNGQIDTNNTGNTVTKFNAATVPQITNTPVFARETFETSAANNRFMTPLTESGNNPNQASPTFQRVTGEQFGGFGTAGKMYAPDFSPGHEANPGVCEDANGCGGQSDYSAVIGPINNLTATSIMEFDHSFNQEAFFDGGVLEVKVGSTFTPADSTPFPDNVATFDLSNFIIEGNYNSALDGDLPEVPNDGSALQGRLAFTGVKGLHHTRISLNDFAPGSTYNPQSLPVYIRFRNTSDVATANGVDAGWYIDNLVINNLACLLNVASAATGAIASASSTYANPGFPASGAINGEHTGLDWGNNGGWNDNSRDVWPDSLDVALNGTQTISEIRVYTLQNDFRNPVEPTATTPADLYGIRDFEVQSCAGNVCTTVPGGTITNNDKAMRVITLATPIATNKLRIVVNAGRSNWSRIVEVEALGCRQ